MHVGRGWREGHTPIFSFAMAYVTMTALVFAIVSIDERPAAGVPALVSAFIFYRLTVTIPLVFWVRIRTNLDR